MGIERWADELGMLAGGAICVLILTRLAAMSVRAFVDWLRENGLYRQRLELLRSELSAIQQQQQATPPSDHWSGFRRFRVVRKEREADDCYSLYLQPNDQRPAAPFLAGQYLTFRLRPPGVSQPLIRCYSISSAPDDDLYRCTIKKVPPPLHLPMMPAGRGSCYLCDTVETGDVVEIAAPRGSFHLEPAESKPVVLLGAGIGVTPLLSMLADLVARRSSVDIYALLGFRNRAQHPFREAIARLADESPSVHLRVFYSQPSPTDERGSHFDVAGRIDMAAIQRSLPSSNFQFYVCGPQGFLDDLVGGLRDWGVPSEDIKTEAFGAESAKALRGSDAKPLAEPVRVQFARSGVVVDWDGEHETLLDLAEANGVPLDTGCRSGHCGTCMTTLREGRVAYAENVVVEAEPNTCLPCVCTPETPLVIDA